MDATIAVLYPRRQYDAMPPRYASWQTQSRLRNTESVEVMGYYDSGDSAADAISGIEETQVLVVLDPLVALNKDTVDRLRAEAESNPATPLVLRSGPNEAPLLYICATELLRNERRTLPHVIEGREVIQAKSVPGATWEAEPEPDLESYVPPAARSLLHLLCSDGSLGERIRRRQKCRVVGIETDRALANIAKKRIDDVYTNAVDEVLSILEEHFECIVVSGIIEHVDDPWSLLATLRGITSADGTLVASIPNLGTARAIQNLIAGQFSVASQVRFFTRESIVELMDISGWTVEAIGSVSVDPQRDERMFAALRSAGFQTSDDLFVTRFNVVARNYRG